MKRTTVNMNGFEVPRIGLGTYELRGERCRTAVGAALAEGYRHLDTAAEYGNEPEVGDAIRASTVPRDQIWITTKVWWDRLGRAATIRSAEESLRRLRTDWVDLLLIHWPNHDVSLEETLGAMNELHAAGKVRAIGVSNFPPPLLDVACDHAGIACDQVEYHPFLSQRRLLAAARKLNVAVTAYSPLAQGRIFQDPTIQRIAAAHRRRPAQIVLRWLVTQPGVLAIPRSGDPDHIRSNFDVEGLELTEEDEGAIGGLARGERLVDPDFAPDWNASARDLVSRTTPGMSVG